MKEKEPKRPSWEEFWSYLKREGKGHTEFRLVLYENKTAYIHVMNRDSESFNFELPKVDWEEAKRRASFELSPDWTEEEYEWARNLTKELRYDSNFGTDGKKRVIAHLRKWISRVGETPKPDQLSGLLWDLFHTTSSKEAEEKIQKIVSTVSCEASKPVCSADVNDNGFYCDECSIKCTHGDKHKFTSVMKCRVSGEAKAPDLTLRLTPEIKLEDGKFILLLNGEKWVKELSGGSVPTPSDEEIEAEIQKLPYTKHLDDGQFNDGVIQGFELGARWSRGRLSSSKS